MLYQLIMNIYLQEERDSVRVVWNVMPNSKTLQLKTGIPQALHYTPLSQKQQSFIKNIPPQCQTCQAYLNPYNPIPLNKQSFICCICKNNNILPANYLQNKQKYPPQLQLDFSSFLIARRIDRKQTRTGYLFVVDVAISTKQLSAIKQSILNLISNVHDDCRVGLISYNKYTHLYNLSSKICTTVMFSPQIAYRTLQIAYLIGHSTVNDFRSLNSKYIMKLGDCRQKFIEVVNSLKSAQHRHGNQRPARSVGQALNVGLSLNQLSTQPNRIILFCGGVCTSGPGKIIDQDYKSQMRSLKQDTPIMSSMAVQFYNQLLLKALSKMVAIDSFIFAVEEVGLSEMLRLLTQTGGLLVQHQLFDSSVFRQSFRKAYCCGEDDEPLEKGVEVYLKIHSSPEIKITGLEVKETNKDQNQFNQYILGNIDQNKTLTIYYDLKEVNTEAEAYFIQLRTSYTHPDQRNIRIQRVTTIRRVFGQFIGDIASGFDQQAALALLVKQVIQKNEDNDSLQVRKWIDNLLCKWASLFGQYIPGDRQSFKLPPSMMAFPQYVYHLRRHYIVRKSGLSLDEYCYICHIAKRQSVRNITTIIQPALLQYTLEHNTAKGVTLDQKHMKPQTILVLDSFFNLVQWHGRNIVIWLQNKFNQQPQYEQVDRLIKAPKIDITLIKNSRFPVPQYYLTSPDHSKQRFIKSRLAHRLFDQSESNLSDEADVLTFTTRLIDLVVLKQL